LILAGDVGGTKTLLGLYDERGPDLLPVREAALASREFSTFEEVVDRFLADSKGIPIRTACFGVAGPVVDGRSVTTNLPWTLDEVSLAERIRASSVRLLNDLEATGHGALTLPPSAVATLQGGAARRANMALIAAGTGLGEALLVWDGTRHLVVASEGGHVDFAPRSELESELLAALRKKWGRVSYERVLSGPGLANIYGLLREQSGVREPDWLRARMETSDPSRVVSEVALAGEDPVCDQALDLFVSIYGAEAGNLALKALAVGGVFVGGGIAPKIRARLDGTIFLAAFRDKGRLTDLMTSIPVHLILEPRAALLGAAKVAREL
jgi:glucokinase